MLRLCLAVAFGATALGQQPTLVRNLSPLRDAGVYHLATGTWSRGAPTAAFGPDVIYNASVPSGYFATGWEGQEGVDEGVLPGSTSPWSGPADAYEIDGFTFGYCSSAGSIDWEFRFYDSYFPCDVPTSPANCITQASDTVLVLGAPTAGACWLVTVDLTGAGEFCMHADGGPCAPGYQGVGGDLDSFGWGAVWSGAGGGASGPLLDGLNPSWAAPGEGTCYHPAQTCNAGTTGLGADDYFGIGDGGPVAPGCYWFGGPFSAPCGLPNPTPNAQFHMVMFTDCAAPCAPCRTTSCEAGPDQLGTLVVDTCSLSAGPVLQAQHLTGGLFAMGLVGQGTGVLVDPPGAYGELCLGGAPIGRYTADAATVVGLADSVDLVHGATGGGTGQLPDPPGGVLQVGATWRFQTWVRVQGGSRFTPVVSVTFEP